jgi:hypothetical protein
MNPREINRYVLAVGATVFVFICSTIVTLAQTSSFTGTTLRDGRSNTFIGVGAGQSNTTGSDKASPAGQTSKRKGTNLVKELPAGVDGVTLEDGFIKLKPGYKFVKEKNGRASVYLMKGGGGLPVSGSFDCSCASKEKDGKCKLGITSDKMTCFDAALYCTRCELVVIVNEATTRLIEYGPVTTHLPATGHSAGRRIHDPIK